MLNKDNGDNPMTQQQEKFTFNHLIARILPYIRINVQIKSTHFVMRSTSITVQCTAHKTLN